MNLLVVEMRRAMRRRVVRVLIVLALLGCVFAGVIALTSSTGKTLAELHMRDQTHPAVLADWWISAKSDGAALMASFFLLLGGVFAGASVAGAEWRAGTITTVLTWEPRRIRLNLARTAACGILAFVIALALQVIFLASFLPAVLANGTTAGADADWWLSLALVIARTALLTSIAAMLAVALATLGRNTAFALAAVFAWFAVIENMIRGLRPSWAQYLWGENIGTVVPWHQMKGVDFTRGPMLALGTILLYTAVIIVAATIAFKRRDIAGTS
jgi:ABC-type transport system involved in multi-copper enzyme maturation permease subunit